MGHYGNAIKNDSPNSKHFLIQLITFDKNEVNEYYGNAFDDIRDFIDQDKINWIHLNNLKTSELETIAESFDIHSLIIEDIKNTDQLPKLEANDNHLFFTLKFLRSSLLSDTIEFEHVVFILGENFIISGQQRTQDLFGEVKQWINADKGKIRKKSADYLFYLLLDYVVDNYYYVLENLRELVELLEDELIENTNINYTNKIHGIKKQLNTSRKFLFPAREAINELKKEETNLIERNNAIYFNDVYDHIEHLIALSESFRETVTSLIEMNTSNLSTNMNKVMQRLTVVSTVFIPLTFIVGMYGMNFEFMPELKWQYSYPILLLFMFLVAAGITLYMKMKRWF